MKTRRIVLASRPASSPGRKAGVENFRLETVELPPLQDGEVLVRNEYLSLDPYMRGRMDDVHSYTAPQPLGQTMVGGTAGRVVESRNAEFPVGAAVVGMLGWCEHGIATAASGLRTVPADRIPLSAWLGPAGMPGVTAWVGLNRLLLPSDGQSAAGQTLCVSAASGAVGSVVGQLAKAAGCRVIGIAGGPRKCQLLTDEYGFDVALDYRSPTFADELKAATPDRVDMLFENVGGAVMDAVLSRMNAFGRVALCGLIAGYGGEDIAMRQVRSILVNRLRVQGFIVFEYLSDWPQALDELSTAIAEGRLKYRETVAEGLEQAPQAFFSLLDGGNVGKQLVRLAAPAA